MSTRTDGPDPARTKLRTAIARVERDLASLPADSALRASVAELVQQLALGPEPELRTCPHCEGVGMRLATRCLFCWSLLVPPTE